MSVTHLDSPGLHGPANSLPAGAYILADPSACLRWLALRDLFQRAEDDIEVRELAALRETDPLVMELARAQQEDGSWKGGGAASRGGAVLATARTLSRLGYLGFGLGHSTVQRGAEYLFAQQRKDGAWPLASAASEEGEGEGYTMVPLQTALPLRGLAACGYATDPRAERAYDWLIAQRLPDGAWPTGIASGVHGYVAGYRRLAHSRWGCRSNTTGALICLALHPQRRTGEEARRGLDLLLGRETREQHTLGYEVARLIGAEPARGFFTFYARFDLALLLDLCWRVGATREDARVAELAGFVRGLRGPYGLWNYAAKPQVSRWLTFDLLRSLARLGESGDWQSAEPRTPFRPYPKRARRY
jgi:hypothetical protein